MSEEICVACGELRTPWYWEEKLNGHICNSCYIDKYEEKSVPAKSKAQLKFINANREKLEKQGMDVDEWNEASKGKKLPARVGRSKKRKGRK